MTNPFVKTETVVTTSTETKINYAINESGPGGVYMSVQPDGPNGLQMVIGAQWEKRCAYFFCKQTLAELIGNLQEIHDLMPEPKAYT